MQRLRSSLVLPLLLGTCSAALITGTPACDPCSAGGWIKQRYELPADLPADATLRRAITVADLDGITSWVVGDRGVLVRLADEDDPANLPRPSTTDLRGITVADARLVVVGLGGVLVVGDLDGTSWTRVDLGTTADLFHVTSLTTRFGEVLVAVGDDVMFTRHAKSGGWRPVPAPQGGWGRLRGAGLDIDGTLFAIGLGGVLWSAPEVVGPWTRVDLGITADLTTLAPPGNAVPLIGGSDGTLLGRASEGWRPIVLPFTADVADITSASILTTDGEVYSYALHPLTLEKIGAPGLGLYTLSELGNEVVALGKPDRQVSIRRACSSSGGL